MRVDQVLELHDPGVTFSDRWRDGTRIDARFSAWKTMRDGTERAYIIKLDDLSTSELACIARSATQALRTKVEGEKQGLDRQLQRAKGAWE